MTWVDLYFAAILDYLTSMTKPDLLYKHSSLKAIADTVFALDSIKDWMKKRPIKAIQPAECTKKCLQLKEHYDKRVKSMSALCAETIREETEKLTKERTKDIQDRNNSLKKYSEKLLREKIELEKKDTNHTKSIQDLESRVSKLMLISTEQMKKLDIAAREKRQFRKQISVLGKRVCSGMQPAGERKLRI